MKPEDILTKEQMDNVHETYDKLLAANSLNPSHYEMYVTLEFVKDNYMNNEMTIVVQAKQIDYKFRAVAGKFNFENKQ